jgi:DNA repair protein RecO (recombination protein O)
MQISTEGIVVRRIKYGESGSIVHIFTRSSGMRHFIVKSGKHRNSGAFFFPLAQLEFVMTLGKENALGYLKDIRISYPYKTMYQDVKRSAVAIFLSEVLSHVLQNEIQNIALFNFVQQSLQKFDIMQDNPNFHILFLLDLTEFLGFCPQRNGNGCSSNNGYGTHGGGMYFDLRNGCFCTERPLHNNYFEGNKAVLFSNLVHRREVGERLPLLEALLSYYRIHTSISDNIHSLSILHEVFL